jgi:hypothetical protein
MNGASKSSVAMSITRPMLPVSGDESNVEQTL